MPTLQNGTARAKSLAKQGQSEAAMSLADDLVAEYPSEIEAWLLRGFLHELEDNYPPAVADLTRAIELNTKEPLLFYNRGRYLFQLRDYEFSERDFSEGLRLCDFYKNDYYREELHFWRAESRLLLGRREAATRDLADVSNDFASWTYKLRTKQDLQRDLAQSEGDGSGTSVVSATFDH